MPSRSRGSIRTCVSERTSAPQFPASAVRCPVCVSNAVVIATLLSPRVRTSVSSTRCSPADRSCGSITFARLASTASVICMVLAAPLAMDLAPARNAQHVVGADFAFLHDVGDGIPDRLAFSISPTCSSIITAERNMAIGFTMGGLSSAYFGAEPCVGSNTATSSPMLPEAAKPRPPTSPAKASEMTSPNRFEATITP